MGFLKRLFSIRSRKSKKRSAVIPCVEALPPVREHLNPCHIDDTEAEVSRLLRSSSARHAAKPQIGLASLPPLPHPIDSVARHPKSSTTTLASVSARSTYSVTIHGRTVHSRTEFPNAYPPMDATFTPKRSVTDSSRRRSKSAPITPRDKNRLLLLRQDPSVANLLSHYDDQGHLNSTVFSNSPPPQKQGRVQRCRARSTLRQLLGHPSSPNLRNTSTEGDISWAERFLGETDDNSSVSSIGPPTPVDDQSILAPSIDDKTAPSIECDTLTANHHTFSSLEVELSVSTDRTQSQVLSSPYGDSMTPQRASQIFGFLGDKRAKDGPASRLPQLKTTTPHHRRFSTESTISDTNHTYIPVSRRTSTHIPRPISPTNQRRISLVTNRPPPSSPIIGTFLPPQPENEESTSAQPFISQPTGSSSCGPRGACPNSKIMSRHSTGTAMVARDLNGSHRATGQFLPLKSALGERSNTDNKCVDVVTARPRETYSQIPKLRSTSGSSSSTTRSMHDPVISSRQPSIPPTTQTKPRSTEAELPPCVMSLGKENDTPSRLPQPVTPVRPFGLHPHQLREPTSPASSSELSPVARQMMDNLRQQRMHARQRERRAGRLGSSQSRIRY